MSKASVRNRAALRMYRFERDRKLHRFKRAERHLNRPEFIAWLTKHIVIRMPNGAMFRDGERL